jgi:predicted dienelactone hydrolase
MASMKVPMARAGFFPMFLARVLVACCFMIAVGAAADPALVVPPLPLPGPYPVACSNVTQDFSRLAPGEDVQNYWEGVPRTNGTPRYVTDLLSDSTNTLQVSVAAPANSDVFGSFAGRSIPVVIVVCYPTTVTNPRPDYALPNGNAVPHMQRGSEAPLFADPAAHFPLLLFSHGLLGSPLSNDYVAAMSVLASNGYIVAAPFHGDGRITILQPESLTDFTYLLTHLRDFNALQALRPLALSATLDLLQAHPQWRTHIDLARIGGFGASLGGESLLLMAGAGLTTTVGLSWTKVIQDSRLRVVVGYVPYFGQPGFPAFGRDQHGLDDLAIPVLAISGTADTTAPLALTAQGMAHLAGPRELVELVGVTHGFDVASTNDIFTWSVTFLDAELRNDPVAQTRLSQMASVAGGGDDHVLIASGLPQVTNYGGMWWNDPAGSEAGWGINFAHQGDIIFATWFTYDQTGSALWLVMTAYKTSDGVYSGTLYTTTGPPFNAVPFDPSRVVRTAVGNGTLTFSDPNTGTFFYTVNGITQTKPITRQVFGPLPTCAYASQPNLALAINFQDLWWKPSESGWGLSLTQQGTTIFGVWFTYEQDGTPIWLSFTATPTSVPGTYTGALYRASGPAFYTLPFVPTHVTQSQVGTATLTFTDGNHAAFAYTLFGVAQAKSITREVFQGPGTACQ